MTESVQWTEVADAVQSSDPDHVNDVIDRLDNRECDRRLRLFDIGFEDLTSIYAESEDGYVRQSVVRVTEKMILGMASGFVRADAEGSTDETREDVTKRLDTATGFLIEALQDDDGRVRQSAERALKGVYRGYAILEDTETVAALASELDALAAEYEGKRRKHLRESKADAEFLLGPAGNQMVEDIRQLANSRDL